MFKKFAKRSLSILLCLVMLLTYLPAGGTIRVQAVGEQSGVLSSRLTADPSTLHAWRDTAFNPFDLTTEHAGGVWTDKSVIKAEDASAVFVDKNGNPLGITANANNFLVALSALGANSVVAGQASTPTDTIFVLDVSNSMSDDSDDLTPMVTAANDAIHSLLTANKDNRVGVVVYSTEVKILLPLDRYTPVEKGYGNNKTTAYIEVSNRQIRTARITEWVSTGGGGGWPGGGQNGYWNTTAIVKNSSGNDVDESTSATGATYIQGGLWQAYQMFNNATVSDSRTPVLVLMSDGAPSYGTENYNNVDITAKGDVGDGTQNSITDGLAFLTQLTAAYVKEKITDKYNTAAYFYSVGLGVSESNGSVSIAEAVLDTSKTREDPESWWNTYLGLANQTTKTMSFSAARENVTITHDATITSASKNYTNHYFPASDASQLSSAFQSVVNEINLKASYNVTRIDGTDANTGGYITFVDEIGSGMEVKDIKGILIGDKLHSGEALAEAFENGEFGTADNLTPLGRNMVSVLQDRLRIADSQDQTAVQIVMDLISQAKAAGQIYYSATGWSNYIGWFGNANGEFVGFWNVGEENLVIPEGATHANISYGMLGATTDNETAQTTDMMYAVITVSKKITGGKILANSPQIVTFRVPASLLPTITYEIEVEAASGEEITEETNATITYNQAEPIRLVYEVGVHSELTPLNIKEFLRTGYPAKDANGNYYLYTNAWQWDGATEDTWSNPSSHPDRGSEVLYDTGKNRITYAYFEPSEQNEHYYFTEDTILYTYNGTAYEKVTTAPVDGVQYYFQHKTFTANATQIGVEVTAEVDIHYGKVEPKALAHAVQGDDGVYYIKEGTMHYGTIHEHDQLKGYPSSLIDPENPNKYNYTGSFKYRMHQLVDIAVAGEDADSHHFEITYLGNNGRITYAPAQGLKLSKVMNDGSVPDKTFAFEVALTAPAGQALANAYETVHVAANGTETKGSADISAEGKASVSLKPGESIYILGLTAGTRYIITEGKIYGYRLNNAAGDVGQIHENEISKAVFTNMEQHYGVLTVSKWVTYEDGVVPAADNHAFDVTVTLMDGQEKYEGNVFVDDVQTAVTNGIVTFRIKHGQQVVISDIPVGVTYSIAEDKTTLPDGYTWTNEGAATLSGTMDADGQSAELKNTYDPADVVIGSEIELNIKKLFTYESTASGSYSFDFQLQRRIADNNWVGIANGSVSFVNPARGDNAKWAELSISGQNLTAVGEYDFRIAEIIPQVQTPGMTYDPTNHGFRVTVSDANLDGKLEIASVEAIDSNVTVTSTDAKIWTVKADFQNRYVVHSTKLTIAANKALINTLTNENILKDGQFEFALYETDSSYNIEGKTPVIEKNGANGDIIFPSITYKYEDVADEGNTYYYVMKELSDNDKGITSDKTEWWIQVKVDKVNDGEAHAAATNISYKKKTDDTWQSAAVSEEFDEITFENTYTPQPNTGVSLYVNKTLTNGTPGVANTVMTVPANIYKFKLGAITPGAPMPAVSEVFAAQGGEAVFAGFTFTQVGEYEYVITEVNTNVAGVTYDASIYRAVVTVTDDGLGQLKANVVYYKNGIHTSDVVFANTYMAAPVTIHVEGDATVTDGKIFTDETSLPENKKDLDDYAFKFVLAELDGTVIETVEDNGAGFSFADIEYVRAGEYQYLIYEMPTNEPGVAFDSAKYRVTVTVTDNGEGALEADVKYEKAINGESNDYEIVSGILFENSYRAKETAVIFSGTKTLAGGRKLKANEFSFILKNASGEELETVKNKADGTFVFTEIVYYTEGTYVYTLEEVKGNADGITYDTAKYTLTVTVADVNGELKATTVITKGAIASETAGFTNIFTPDAVDTNIVIQKELVNKSEEAMGLDGFKFLLEGEGTKQTLTTDSNGKAELTLTFTAEDVGKTYTFKLSEVAGNVEYMSYDKTVYEIIVKVTQSEDGHLELAIEREGTGDFTFVNTYEPPVEEEPTEPAPTEPTPTEPTPTEPAPTEPTPTEPAPTEPSQPNEEPPKTSDKRNAGLMMTLMLSSVACLFVLVVSQKRFAGKKENGLNDH